MITDVILPAAMGAPTEDPEPFWKPLLALLAGVALALSAAWWPRAWRWLRWKWTLWKRAHCRHATAHTAPTACPGYTRLFCPRCGLNILLSDDAHTVQKSPPKWMQDVVAELRGRRGRGSRPISDYIPTDLDSALDELDRNVSTEDKAGVLLGTVDPAHLHFGFGTGLRNRWGLWHDSRLAKWFQSRGIFHADDMSGLILKAWFCRLRGEVFDFEKEKQVYLDHWARAGCDASGRPLDD